MKSYRRAEPRILAGPTRFPLQSEDAYSRPPGLGSAERDSSAILRRSFLLPIQWSRVLPNREAEQSIESGSARSGFQNTDEWQVPVPLLVVETVTDDELIVDIESDVIRLDGYGSLLLFAQKHTTFHA
jgi:hypothetical protein